GLEHLRQIRVLRGDRLADEAAVCTRLAFGCEELVAPVLPMLDPVRALQPEPVQHAGGALGAGLGAELLDDAAGLAQLALGLPVDPGGGDLGFSAGGDAERAAL